MSTKGSVPRKGHNPDKQRKNCDDIDWSKKSKKATKERIKKAKVIDAEVQDV